MYISGCENEKSLLILFNEMEIQLALFSGENVALLKNKVSNDDFSI